MRACFDHSFFEWIEIAFLNYWWISCWQISWALYGWLPSSFEDDKLNLIRLLVRKHGECIPTEWRLKRGSIFYQTVLTKRINQLHQSQTRLIGRRYFTDDPFVVQRIVLPGRMTLGKEGLLLGICMFGAFFGNLFWGPMADAFGRKLILEIALVIMFVFSVLSVRTNHVLILIDICWVYWTCHLCHIYVCITLLHDLFNHSRYQLWIVLLKHLYFL